VRGTGSPSSWGRRARRSTSLGGTTRAQRSEYGRPETIEETAELVAAAGGQGIAVQVNHLVDDQVRALVERIRAWAKRAA